MSACPDRNYDVRCITIVFGVCLRESARTAAKRLVNLRTHSGKAIKRLDRLAPNLAHMCRFIWEWIYAKQVPLETQRGAHGGFRGSTIQNLRKLSNGWTNWHHIWYASADSSGNGHRLNTIRPSIPQGHIGGL